MSIEKEFVWNDELVKEFMDKYNNISGWITGIDPRGDKMKEFKQSKLSNDKGSERIKVIGFRSNDGYVPYEKQQQSWSYTLNLSKEVIGDYSEFRKKIEQALNVEDKVVRHVYNSMEFETNAGEKLFLCMRDSGYEIQYFGTTYEFKEGKCIPHIKSDKKYTQSEVDTIREDLWNRCREWADGQWSNQFFPDGKNSQFKYPTLQDYLQSLPENKIKEQDTDTKDWEIVSVEDGVANGSQGKGKIVYIQKGDESSWIKANIKINSVKRLSDGVVFSIGDKVDFRSNAIDYRGTINHFTYCDGIIDLYLKENMSTAFSISSLMGLRKVTEMDKRQSPETLTNTVTEDKELHYFREGYKYLRATNEKIVPYDELAEMTVVGAFHNLKRTEKLTPK